MSVEPIRVGSLWISLHASYSEWWIVVDVVRSRSVVFRRLNPYMQMVCPLDQVDRLFRCISE